MSMKFSVVIPLHNKAQYIQRAIFSVLNQTYDNYEVVVVNDGSTDISLEKASEIKNDRLRILSQHNQGVSAARNKGIRDAKNEWIAFLDADDEWLPTFLQEINALRDEFPDCGVYGVSYQVTDKNKISSPSDNLPYKKGWRGVIGDIYRDFRVYNPFNSSSVVVNRKLLDEVGGFPPNIREGEDNITWMKLFRVTKIAYINTPLSIYHKDAENRACFDFENRLEQYAPVSYLLGLLESGDVPESLRQSAIEYIAKHQILLAGRNLIYGNPQFARQLLLSCKNTKLYRSRWLKVFIISLVPSNVLLFAKKLI